MAVSFNVQLSNDSVIKHKERACFGQLRDYRDYLNWECDIHDVSPVSVEYLPKRHCSYDKRKAEKFYEYLMSKPFISDIVLNKPTFNSVQVSCSAHPHHMLNVLSLFRYPNTFPHYVDAFLYWTEQGVDPDVAFIAASILDYGGRFVFDSNYDTEHTVIHPTSFTITSAIRWMNNELPESDDEPFDVCQCYESGVAQYFSYNSSDTPVLDHLQIKVFNVTYDKESKKVVDKSQADYQADRIEDEILLDKVKKLEATLKEAV